MTEMHQFNLVTLNAFGVPSGRTRARLQTIARELNDRALHAVCLQEVQLHGYVPVLSKAFTNFGYASWEPHLYAPKGGLMTLTTKEQQNVQFIPYESRGWFLGPTIADRMLYKGMLLCTVEHHSVPITIINTHLAANYSGNCSRTNRYAKLEAAQLRQLASVVNIQPEDHIVVVVGDFNIPRYSWLYHEFLEATHLFDPLGQTQNPTYRTNPHLPAFFSSMLNVAIDHALIRTPKSFPLVVESSIILQDKVKMVDGRNAHLSDHYGIHVRLEWPKEAINVE
jgi:endonuclease/exonuclease/phosphatase family metal-dependent hydrolase